MNARNIFTSARRAVATATLLPLARRLAAEGSLAASLVLPTRNCATYLHLTLAALQRQLLPTRAWELIITDDASNDSTPEILDSYERGKRLPLVLQRSAEPCGRAAAINQALAIAQGHILVFLEDDQIVAPDFLLWHLLAHAEQTCVVLGDSHRCLPTHFFSPLDTAMEGVAANPCLEAEDMAHLDQLEPLVFAGETNYQPLFDYFAQQGKPPPYVWAYWHNGNISVPREQVLSAGGLDERFHGWGLEQTDLAYRLHCAGLPFRYEPRAAAIRQLQPARSGDSRSLNRNLRAFLCKHPNLTNIEWQILLKGHYRARE